MRRELQEAIDDWRMEMGHFERNDGEVLYVNPQDRRDVIEEMRLEARRWGREMDASAVVNLEYSGVRILVDPALERGSTRVGLDSTQMPAAD